MHELSLITLFIWLLALGLGLAAFRATGWLSGARRLLGACCFGALGVLLAALLFLLNSCMAFMDEIPVARVETLRWSADEFELVYTPVGPQTVGSQTVRLRGDQWAISGGIIKWHPWLTAMGVKSYHRPMRLSGQFASIQRQRSEPASAHPLRPQTDRLWEALYRAQRHLPFIEAVYGSSAYVYVEPGTVQVIYVTPSGYLIKRNKSERLSKLPQAALAEG